MVYTTSPSLAKEPGHYNFQQGSMVRLSVADLFTPETGLHFDLGEESPSWLHINSKTGLIFGKAPNVYTTQTYKITVGASNQAGSVQAVIFITVARSSVRAHQLGRLNRRYSARPAHRSQSEVDELLAELFEHYQQSEERRDELNKLIELLRTQAKQLGVKAKTRLNTKSFARLVQQVTPETVKQLQQQKLAGTAKSLSLEKAFKLILQGSQPTGTIFSGVYNHLGAVRRHKISACETFLDSKRSDAVKESVSNVNYQPQYSMD